MNEDERGITPPDVTAMTLQRSQSGLREVVIEQGNGDEIKTLELTEMEAMQLGVMLSSGYDGYDGYDGAHVSFVDLDRGRTEPYPAGRAR